MGRSKRVDLGTPADWVAIGISLVGLLVDLIPSMPKEYVYALPLLALLGLFGVARIVLRLLRSKPPAEEESKSGTVIHAEGERSVAGQHFDGSPITTGDIGKQEIHYHYPPPAPPQPAAPIPKPPPYNPDDPVPPAGELPPLSRVPFPRNDCFTGRKSDLKTLADTLIGKGQSAAVGQTAAVIPGLGGLGKTALAVEFAHRYGAFFPGGVFWLHASTDESIAADIADCGLKMGIQPWPDKQPEQVAAVVRTWADGARSLVVLDSVDEPKILRKGMAEIRGPALLVTGRRHDWPADLGLAVHRLGLFSPDEARALLRKLAPRLQASPDAELDAVSGRLGHLPLAVDLAGRYLCERPGLTPRGYLHELAKAENALEHTSLKDWVDAEEVGHAASLAAAFRMSYGRLDANDEADALAMRLFAAAGRCAPNVPIPRQLFRALAALGQAWRSVSFLRRLRLKRIAEAMRMAALRSIPDDVNVDRAVGRLADLGLLSPGEEGPTIHPLLAEFARRMGDKDALSQLVGTLKTLTYRANETKLPTTFAPLRAHVEAAARAEEEADPAGAATLWTNLGYHLNMVAEYKGAAQNFRRALEISEPVLGSDHPAITTCLNNLGGVLQAMGDLPAARDHYERALAIRRKTLGDGHLDVAQSLNNLGTVLRDMGDLPAARNHLERALTVWEKALGPEHPQVATALNNLGNVLQHMGDLPAARNHLERALTIRRKALGDGHPDVAQSLNNLGSVLQAMGDLPAARDHYERALAIFERVLGAEHPNVATLANNLGMVLQAMGDLPAARDHFVRALAIFEKTLPPGHPNIQTVRDNLEALGGKR